MNNGMLRIALSGVTGFVLFESAGFSYLGLLCVLAGVTLGALVVAGKPKVVGSHFFRLAVDVLLVFGVSVAGGIPFAALFFVVALSVLWMEDGTLAAAAGALVVGGYAATMLVLGARGLEVGVPLGVLGAFCAVLWAMSREIGQLLDNSRRSREALDSERGYSGSVSELALSFGPVLEVLDRQRVLAWVAEAARELTGARFAHVVLLDGNNHATSAAGDLDPSPTWWNPVLQEVVLRGSRHRGMLRQPERESAGLRGFLAAPLEVSESEHNGTVVVAGGNFDANDERVLALIASQAGAALSNSCESPGGRDFATGLPNRASLYGMLERELAGGAPLTVVCFRLEGLWSGPRETPRGESALREIGARLGEHGRTYRFGAQELFVVLKSGGDRRVRRFCAWVEEVVVREVSRASGLDLGVQCGYILADPQEYDAESAVRRARRVARDGERDLTGVREGGTVSGTEEPPETLDGVVAALLEAAAIRDRGLAEHMKSVRRLSRMIGREMGLGQGEIGTLSLGALLHDIGKVGVPDSVLKKPGRLTAAEFDLIKQHTVMGAGVMGQVPHLKPIVPIVRHHHERHDGRGYPDGLAGRSIPLLARIVFVADAYDSMVQDRPYRKGRTHEEALEEIRANAGSQFDPEVAAAFLKVAATLRVERFRRSAG
ncbi:HD domain-containing phosphohydrolase [Rubrobacter radiotolerans]|uniref:HD domain-containing protein n=1 Tax=Rubrobacter radiotolerans TaxID=42256 RepID=A0AB35T214_RUBRA|nr:HD domain-containing phosphohydrolase [Rubrobacter radiotolerans]MDX5893661.1 HD domain-containing protein [Rubrobacter radiotolerans]